MVAFAMIERALRRRHLGQPPDTRLTLAVTHPSKRDRALSIASLVLLAAAASVPRDAALGLRAIPVGFSGLVLAISIASAERRRIPLLVFAISGIALTGVPWQGVLFMAVLVAFAASRLDARFGSVRTERGTVPVLFTVVCAAVTPVALLGWVRLLEPDLTHITRAIPELSSVALTLAGAGFALVNAALEEWVWRGLLQRDLSEQFGMRTALLLQALSFGSVHAHGFPSGPIGMALAAVWGLMLGALRVRAGGLLAPVLAHIVADATIALIVLGQLR